ncbi:MAG TPA: hypothetical protein VH333_18455 [Pseudonocardiaceae bacterium]|jgi:type IV secretory pathway VirB2 component (pilin)|nr:hypothetical protein [Pseudonocardiaceae bacterium]
MHSRVAFEALSAVRDSMDGGLAGTVGVVAVLLGAIGLVYGLTRHHRQAVARRAAERTRS